MKKLTVILVFILGLGGIASAQGVGIKVAVDRNGVPIFRVDDVVISAKRPNRRQSRRKERQIKKFNKLRYNILKTLPYANEAARNLTIIEAELANIPTEEAREAYLDSKEDFLFGRYEKGTAVSRPRPLSPAAPTC